MSGMLDLPGSDAVKADEAQAAKNAFRAEQLGQLFSVAQAVLQR